MLENNQSKTRSVRVKHKCSFFNCEFNFKLHVIEKKEKNKRKGKNRNRLLLKVSHLEQIKMRYAQLLAFCCHIMKNKIIYVPHFSKTFHKLFKNIFFKYRQHSFKMLMQIFSSDLVLLSIQSKLLREFPIYFEGNYLLGYCCS